MPSLTESYSAPLVDYPGAYTKRQRLSRAGHWVGTGALTGLMALTRGMRARRGNYLRLSSAARTIQRRFRAGRRVRRAMTVGGRGVTSEHDRQFIYRKKSMPYGKKVRWKRFKRKVNAVAEKELGSQTIIYNKKALKFSNNVTGGQLVNAVGLYTYKSNLDYNNDLANLATRVNINGEPTAEAGPTVQESTKLIFQSAVLDLTMRNTSNKNNVNLDPDCTLEVDIYEITGKRLFRDGTAESNSLEGYFGNAAGKCEQVGANGNIVTLESRGATPWDITYALSRGKIKIFKKTKMFIRNGQTATYQFRDPRRRVYNQNYIGQGQGCNMPNATHWILIIAKAIPGIDVGDGVGAQTKEELTIGVTRKYLFNIEGMSDDRSEYVNQ